jgi:hypothetical protein
MNTQEQKGILSEIIDEPTPLKEVSMAPKNKFESALIWMGLRKKKRVMLYLRDTKLTTNYHLTLLSGSLNIVNEDYGTVDGTMQAIHENSYKLAAYVATAVHNKNSAVPQYLIDTIADEFTNAEMKIALEEVSRRLRSQDFISSLALVQSLVLLNSDN